MVWIFFEKTVFLMFFWRLVRYPHLKRISIFVGYNWWWAWPLLKVWKKMAWYISLKHLLKFAGQKNYNCVTLKKKSQLCHKHNCENNSCVVSMVCEASYIRFASLAAIYLYRDRREFGNLCFVQSVGARVPDFSTCAFQTNGGTSPRCLWGVSHRAGIDNFIYSHP